MTRKLWKDGLLGVAIMGVAAMLEFHWPPLHLQSNVPFVSTGTAPIGWSTSSPYAANALITLSHCAGDTRSTSFEELTSGLKNHDSKELARWCLNGQPLAFARKGRP